MQLCPKRCNGLGPIRQAQQQKPQGTPMPHLKFLPLLLALLIFPGAASADELVPASRIRIGGSGGALGTMQLLADAFKKNHGLVAIVIVPSLGTGGGIKAVLAGAIDVAVAGRPLKEAERAQGLISSEYCRTPLVFATSTQVKASGITTNELVSIYSGELKTWPDGRALRVVLRPESESDTAIIQSISPAMKQVVKNALAQAGGMHIETTDQSNAKHMETTPGAIGTITLGQIISEKRTLQPLTLNGVIPSLQTLSDGSYPYFKTFSLLSTPKTSPIALQFIDFVRSPAGQQILEKNGSSQMTGQ
jgi:phosphate transport system substrate-binding protein